MDREVNQRFRKVSKTLTQVAFIAAVAWCLTVTICSSAFAQPNGSFPPTTPPINGSGSGSTGSGANILANFTNWNRFIASGSGNIGLIPIIGNVGTNRYGNLRWNAAVAIPGLGSIGFGNTGMGGAGYWDQAGILESTLCRLLALPEGGFGALVMIIAGLCAVVASAIGMYRLALATVVVGVGSWLIYPVMTLFFGETCFGW